MNNRKTTPTRLAIPELVDCSICNGAGQYQGMFHQMVCDACDGNGSLSAKTGELISKEIMVLSLRKERAKQKLLIAHLKQNCSCKNKEQGHFEDFKIVNGGRLRLD